MLYLVAIYNVIQLQSSQKAEEDEYGVNQQNDFNVNAADNVPQALDEFVGIAETPTLPGLFDIPSCKNDDLGYSNRYPWSKICHNNAKYYRWTPETDQITHVDGKPEIPNRYLILKPIYPYSAGARATVMLN